MPNVYTPEAIKALTYFFKDVLEQMKILVTAFSTFESAYFSDHELEVSRRYSHYSSMGLCDVFNSAVYDVYIEDQLSKEKSHPEEYRGNPLVEKLTASFNLKFEQFFKPIIANWKYYTDHALYLIPAPCDVENLSETKIDPDFKTRAMNVYVNTANKYIGEYGKLRLDLFNYVYEQFNQDPESYIREFIESMKAIE